MYSYDYTQKIAMQDLEIRKGVLLQVFGFSCCCELCREEEICNDDDKTYPIYEILDENVPKTYELLNELIKLQAWRELVIASPMMISNYKKMYNLTKSKKAPRGFILKIFDETYLVGAGAYFAAKKIDDSVNMEHFQKECEKIAMAGEQVAKIAYGSDSVEAKEWMERHQNFEIAAWKPFEEIKTNSTVPEIQAEN